ncbi:class I SAM-dependent methyltransferase [Nocardia barduliensis]|uniref:class I SAM-dependent methyltransferase n=1 Tax=Nocardia barduliensis TaxID=2736643 RepID=UPI001572458D|nr:class I SAM-dependent methyltransferase [Nocardia barduliensis]
MQQKPLVDQQAIWDGWAEVYDEWHAHEPVTAPVDFLTKMVSQTNSARILELGVGTGRVAAALAEATAVPVFGLDISAEMIAKLRSNYPDAGVVATQADMSDVLPWQDLDLVYAVYSSLLNLTTAAQLRSCIKNVAAALQTGGHFVTENMYPSPTSVTWSPRMAVRSVSDDGIMFSASQSNFHEQTITMQEVKISTDGRVQMYPIKMRYTTPPELDLLAELHDLHLVSRFGGFNGSDFTRSSTRFVSVYKKGE